MKKYFSTLFLFIFCLNIFAQDNTDSIANDTVVANDASASNDTTVSVVSGMKIATPEDLIARATLAYEQGNYKQTIDDYESLVHLFGTMPDLYYNLGNAYYKNKEYAKAILNYERCLLYEPSNGDAQTNLEMAQQNCVDKIETIQPVIFKAWSNSLRDSLSANAWSNASIILFILFIVSMFVYFFVRKVTFRKIGFYGGILAFLLCMVSIYYGKQQTEKIDKREYAIVMAPTVTVKSSPADSGTQLFTVHEGLKVKVKSTLSGWSEVELSDGNVGWLPSASIEII